MPFVSILVFLELALGFIVTIGNLYGRPRFNPCFLGTCPRMIADTVFQMGRAKFQSLFSWNLPSDSERFFFSYLIIFVSILVFLELALGSGPNTSEYPSFSSFNPCFLGTCPRIAQKWMVQELSREFQSLFSWNLPSDAAGVWATLSPLCFNPCFLGTCPRIWAGVVIPNAEEGFNPCFLGTCPRISIPGEMVGSSGGVSILVFLELALGLPKRTS